MVNLCMVKWADLVKGVAVSQGVMRCRLVMRVRVTEWAGTADRATAASAGAAAGPAQAFVAPSFFDCVKTK